MISAKKEIAKSVKTLIVMLQSIKDQQVTITLRNDSIVTGTIVRVDANMNIELKEATVQLDPFYCTDIQPEQTKHAMNAAKDSDSHEEDQQDHSDGGTASGGGGGDGCDYVIDDSVSVDQTDTTNHSIFDTDALDVNSCWQNDNANDDDGDSATDSEPTTTRPILYDYFVLRGSRIRHIDLPTDCDLIASTKCEIERIRGRRKQWTKRDIVHSSGAT